MIDAPEKKLGFLKIATLMTLEMGKVLAERTAAELADPVALNGASSIIAPSGSWAIGRSR